MRQMINGKEYEITEDENGTVEVDVVRDTAKIPSDRIIVRQSLDGSNEILNDGDIILVKPGEHFIDMPRHVNG
ncbi:MAG: hypothetical protein JW709_12835 [Sedimentisphaerales bacterium]|nr:hypothetical protein [Sedimentisphaerales bacterium]